MLRLNTCVMRQGEFTLAADLEIPVGQKIAVIGPSGGGKSTLLSAIAGFITPDAGSITWEDAPMTASAGQRPISMVFQDNNLFPHLTAFQNAGLGRNPNLRLSPADKADVAAALDKVGLDGKQHARPADLSGGQQSRVALARVLVRAQPLILLDEPFAALGPAMKEDMLALVDQIAHDLTATVLMVSHDPQDAKGFADQVVLVADGIAHAPVPTRDIFDHPPASLRDYLGQRG